MRFMLENTMDEVTIPTALEHTLIAMGIVFSVLILISFIIYLLKFVPEFFEQREKRALQRAIKKQNPAAPSHVQTKSDGAKTGTSGSETVSTAVKQPERGRAPVVAKNEKPGNDYSLIAVITAAIAMQMTEQTGVPVAPDGLVIRSIKKRTI